jgi:hypothetical protein
MTNDDWRLLQSGDELDRLVAAALGWTDFSEEEYSFENPEWDTEPSPIHKHWVGIRPDGKQTPVYHFSQSIDTAIGAIESLTMWDGGPMWWVAQRLPGRPADEQYACFCDGIREHIYAATLPLAICRAILLRAELAPQYIRGVWYDQR